MPPPLLLILYVITEYDSLCGLVVTIPGYSTRGPGFDSRRYRNFWELVSVERRPFSLVRMIQLLLGRNNSGSGLENRN
jgi:hypothetical protein